MLGRALRSRTLWSVLGALAAGVAAAHWIDSIGGPAALWARFGWWAPTLTVGLHALVSLSPLPSDPIAIANGALYGTWIGAGVGFGGWYLAAWIRFWVGRQAGRDLPIDAWWSRLPPQLQQLPVGHPAFLMLSRYIPYVGGEIATLVPGARGVPTWRFAWCTALAIAPYALGLALLGRWLA